MRDATAIAAPAYIAEQIDRLAVAGDEAGAAMWKKVAARCSDLQERPLTGYDRASLQRGTRTPSVKLTEGKKMLSPNEFDAELHDWIIVMHATAFMTCPIIVGTVWHDKTGRFADRRTIRTSALLTPVEQIQPGAIVQTLNTRYLMVGPPTRQN